MFQARRITRVRWAFGRWIAVRLAISTAMAVLVLPLPPFESVAQAQRRPPASEATPDTDDYDVVFLGPQGAVFFRLKINPGEYSVDTIRRRYADGVFRVLDGDGDQLLSEPEARSIPAAGQRVPGAEPLGDRWIELDQSPRNGSISADELYPFIDEKLGPRFRIEARSLRLQQTVQLNGELDVDGDELITRAEIEQGMLVLRPYDFDDDETLSVAELQPFPTAILQAQQQERLSRPAELAVVALDSAEHRQVALQRIGNLYGRSGAQGSGSDSGVPVERIGIPQDAFGDYDRNRDAVLDEQELAKLLESPAPAYELLIRVRASDVQAPWTKSQSALAKYEPVPAPKPRTRYANRRSELVLAGMDVNVRATSDIAAGMSDANTMIFFYLQRIRQFDADKNGYLDQGEFATLGVPGAEFAAVDENRDSMVVYEELEKSLKQIAALEQAALLLTISDDAKTLFEILDANLDNRLGPREFREGAKRIREYDANRDGRLARAEMRTKYGLEVSLARPDFLNVSLTDPNMMQQARQGRVSPATSGPTWFRKMDRNQDGDLTWREFLGQRADFNRIDANQDGLIDLNEAVAAE
jgi:Ca2+-binding EF-hand superfamily protein